MKRLLSMLLVLTLCLSLAACGGKSQASGGSTNPPSEAAKDTQNAEHPYEEDSDLPGLHKVNLTSV